MALSLMEDCLDFIQASPTSFHACNTLEMRLEKKGFLRLSEKESWNLSPDKGYFISRNNSSVVAFVTGLQKPWESGFSLAGAHTDSPGLKIKNNSLEESIQGKRVTLEVYGNPIISSWLDRELFIAGILYYKDQEGLKEHLLYSEKPLAVIPNLAIHLNREINNGFEYNRQVHLPALLTAGQGKRSPTLFHFLEQEAGLAGMDILDADLFLCDGTRGNLLGSEKGLVVSPRLDDLAMVHAIQKALIETGEGEKTRIGFFMDNEEIGSRTWQGADSSFLSSVLERIVLGLGGGREEYLRSLSLSFLISADSAHGIHPNYPDKHDPDYAPKLNEGPVIKYNGLQRYATTSKSAAFFMELCSRAGVKYQKFLNRSDMQSGQTIGAMTSALLGMPAVDVGNPILAMHSVRETAGVQDHEAIIKVFREFYK